jgi:hypothetical protein
MKTKIDMNSIYAPSEDIVAREIEGELIIVPLASGIGDQEDELYTLNETGRAIWDKLDGAKSLGALVQELAAEFNAPPDQIRKDAFGLLEELVKRKIVVERRDAGPKP